MVKPSSSVLKDTFVKKFNSIVQKSDRVFLDTFGAILTWQ